MDRRTRWLRRIRKDFRYYLRSGGPKARGSFLDSFHLESKYAQDRTQDSIAIRLWAQSFTTKSALKRALSIHSGDLISVRRPRPRQLGLWFVALSRGLEESGKRSLQGIRPAELVMLIIRSPRVIVKVLPSVFEITLAQRHADQEVFLDLQGCVIELDVTTPFFDRVVPLTWTSKRLGAVKSVVKLLQVSHLTESKAPSMAKAATSGITRLARQDPRLGVGLWQLTLDPELRTAVERESTDASVSRAIQRVYQHSHQRMGYRDHSDRIRVRQPFVPQPAPHEARPLVSHAQFRERISGTLNDVEVWHGRFVVDDTCVYVMDNGEEPRSESVAGNHQYQFSSPIFGESIAYQYPRFSQGRLDEAIVGCGRVDDNWFHFLTELLPRVLASSRDHDSRIPIIHRSDAVPAGLEALATLTGRELISTGSDWRLEISTLYFSTGWSPTLDSPFIPSMGRAFRSESLNEVREAAWQSATSLPDPGVRKLCLLRSSRYRRMRNWHSVQRRLVRGGFEVVDMSSLPFLEQVALMRGADSVFLQGGAAMANLIFARPETKVSFAVGPLGNQAEYWQSFLSALTLDSVPIVGRHAGAVRGPVGIHSDFVLQLGDLAEMHS